MKEDYIASQIFATASYVLVVGSLAITCAHFILPSWWFWFAVLGVTLGAYLGVKRFRLRFFELLEALVAGFLPVLLVFFIYWGITMSSFLSYQIAGFIFSLTILFYVLDAHYKKFTWYRSGRVGFSGLVILGVFFLARAIVAISDVSVITLVPSYEVFVSGVAAFSTFLALFILAR